MGDVREYGAVGDGRADDTLALQHALSDGDGVVVFPRGTYRITAPLVVDLARHGRTSIDGSGGVAKLVMDGPGPAIFLKGTHAATADPGGFRPSEWVQERMPTVRGIEIEGRHPEADGIRIVGVMQPTLTNVLIRHVRTAVHVTQRARNLILDHCHLYHNTGVGLHLEGLNLHQAIVCGCHISYCRLGGIRVEGSEIRNFQVTGCDIEYNNYRAFQKELPGQEAVPTAEIYIDVSREGASVREGTIASCTIQATRSPGGSNIRFIGRGADGNHKVGMWTISGNLIGSQDNNIHLTAARGVTITGNYIYSGHHRNLLVENCRNIVVGSNCFGHNPDYGSSELTTGVRLVDSVDCNLTGVIIQDAQAGRHTVKGATPVERKGLLEVVNCQRVSLSGTQVIDPGEPGIWLEDCSDTVLTGCTVIDSREEKKMPVALQWTGEGRGNLVTGCRFGAGTAGNPQFPQHVTAESNLTDA